MSDFEKKKNTSVYIGGIDDSVNESDIEKKFSDFGKILEIDIKKGYAFVQYEEETSAEKCVKELDDQKLFGQNSVRVNFSTKSKPRIKRQKIHGYRCFVENLDPQVSWQDLKDLMNREGDVMRADVFRGTYDTYGVVEFRYRNDLHRVLRRLDNYNFKGSRIFLREESPERKRYSPYRGGSNRDRRRYSRSPSPDRRRRRYSPSPDRRKYSRSPDRRRYSRSPSPDRRRRRYSPSPDRRKYSRSPSPDRRKRYSPSPDRRRYSRSPPRKNYKEDQYPMKNNDDHHSPQKLSQ
eukprot:gene6675-10839_t